MGRKTSVALSVLLAVFIGALLARGCYPRRPAPITRAPVSTAASEAPFPEPDIDTLHARVADLQTQLAALRDRLTAGDAPSTLSPDFENAARITADLDARAREIVSRLGANPTVGEAEAGDIKALAARLQNMTGTLVPAARAALASGDKAQAVRALSALAAAAAGVSETSAEPPAESAADAGARATALKSVGENIFARVVKPGPGSSFGAQVEPLIAEAARQLEDMEEALRPAAETDARAAAALKFLESGSAGAPRGALARIARAAKKGDAKAARAAARRFVHAMRGVARTLAHAARGAPAAGAEAATAAASTVNPAAANPVFDQRAPIVRKTPRRRHRTRAAASADAAAAKAAQAAASAANVAAEKNGQMAPVRPKIAVHSELIPKNIKIVRVYYATMIGAPGDTLEFDINGSGFTDEFQKQISIQSGMPNVSVEGATLVTPNQIHARLVIGDAAATSFAFPTVSIGDKVVFQAGEPFAAIRPGEVLNLVFTEMGENGRTGRFRIFTNLTEEQFSRFRVEPSTPAIALGNLTSRLPFIVDGAIQVGPALSGAYGVAISLDGKTLWHRDGIIRIVNPNVGSTGLVLRLQAEDGFQRPGDTARFLVQGSGFQGGDAAALSADIPGMPNATATFTYLAAGRMSLEINIPRGAAVGPYSVRVMNGPKVLLDTLNAFKVVPPNWLRSLSTTPPLKSGGSAQLVLQGRSLQKSFVDSLTVSVDEPGLKIGRFQRVSAIQASADISADRAVRPGDYEVRIRAGGHAVVPENGDIIRVVNPD